MRVARLLTIVCVVVLSLWTLWRGALATAYELAALRPIAGDDIAAVYGNWVHERGVASLALESSMRVAPDAADPAQFEARRGLLTGYLAVVPLSSQRWLELAVMRNALNLPDARIAEALAMSSLTGPNEASVVLRRSAFALSIWEKLDADARGRTANDIAVVAPPLDPGGIKLALAIKTGKVRNEVRDTLVTHGVPAEVVKYIGLPEAAASE